MVPCLYNTGTLKLYVYLQKTRLPIWLVKKMYFKSSLNPVRETVESMINRNATFPKEVYFTEWQTAHQIMRSKLKEKKARICEK